MSDKNTDLAYQEVEDELRRERLNALWAAYGRYLIIAAILVVVIVAGNEAYKSYRNATLESRAERYDEAAEVAANSNALTLIDAWEAELPALEGPYAVLAQFKLATAAIKVGELDKAVATYDAIARSREAGPLLASLAQFRAGTAIIALGGDLVDARSRLTLAARDDAPFRFSAREQLALLDLKAGDIDAARQAFAALAFEAEAPAGVRQRAQTLRDFLQRPVDTESDATPEAEGEAEPTPQAAPAANDGEGGDA